MKEFIIFITISILCFQKTLASANIEFKEKEQFREGKFFGGTAVSSESEYSYVVLITINDANGNAYKYCTGTLITHTLVLTAASCVANADGILVSAGELDASSTNVNLQKSFANKLIYPYFENSHKHDIALLTLHTPFLLGADVSVITLPPVVKTTAWYSNSDFEGKTLRAIGYGGATAGATTLIRNYVDMNVMSTKDCLTALSFLHYDMVPSLSCFYNSTGSPCLVDRGSPIISGGFLVGVMSDVFKCTDYSLFTRIGPYLYWIRRNIID